MRTFKAAIPGFCAPGMRWAKRQPNLRTAWAACQNGYWMAWWLSEYRKVDAMVLNDLAKRAFCRPGFDPFGVRTRQERRRYANLLRSEYLPSGRRRNVR